VPQVALVVFISIALRFYPFAGVPLGTICITGWILFFLRFPCKLATSIASATVLDSIFKDAGVSTTLAEQGIVANHVSAFEPGPSGIAWPKTTLSGSELAGISGSHLDQLHSHLTGPTKDQEAEQLFSITPAQYNSMTSLDFTRPRYSVTSDDLTDPLSPGSQPSHRRNLAETLAAMREQNKGDSAAEIYTRSLLWDKIAPEVVHEFKRIVEESAAMSRPTTADGTKAEPIS